MGGPRHLVDLAQPDHAGSRGHGALEIKAETKVAIAADMWLKSIDESSKAARTKREYRDTWNRYLATPMGTFESETSVSRQ